ncbi:DUF58 domain-containing protein [Haloferula chungangensis]|uniref:DUF58 domain-containing protein n=1 Tax=Haloferula chungangensis TaxID=1048331 RepID=A0ABW2L8E5_9BACT
MSTAKSIHVPKNPEALVGFRSILYPFYFHGAAINHFLRRRIRPAGMGLLIIGMVVTCIAGGQAPKDANPIFMLLSFGMSLGILALLALPFRRARLEVVRDLPRYATAGEPVKLRYRVKNLAMLSLHHAWLTETPPDSRPRKASFLAAREPGGHTRNAFDRLFSYYCWNWLQDRRLAFNVGENDDPLQLKAGAVHTFFAEITPRRRGLIRLDDLRVLLPDPFGLYQRCMRVKAPSATLAVLPHRHRLPPFELPGSARFQPGGDATSRTTGPAGDFVGLREYRPGDPLRLIHWKSWARTGQPIVKELEDSYFPRHGLVLDTFPDPGDEDLFEDAVTVAASFVASVDTQECLIDLMFISGRERVVTAGRGVGRAETLLEVLAGVEVSAKPQFDSLRKLVFRHSEDLAGCLAILSGWSDERARLLNRIAAFGIEIAAIVVCHEPPPMPPPRVHFVRSSQLAKDLMRLPPNL